MKSSSAKRAPPRSAPPITTEEMTVIKKKVAAPKGPPPSGMQGFRPKSMQSSREDDRGSSRAGMRSPRDDDSHRGSSVRSSYDEDNHRGNNWGERRSPRDDDRSANRGRVDYSNDDSGRRRRREDMDNDSPNRYSPSSRYDEDKAENKPSRYSNREDEKYRDRSERERYRRQDNEEEKDMRNREYEEESSIKMKKTPPEDSADEKALGKSDSGESESLMTVDDAVPRMARNGRDIIFNYRPKILHANYKNLRTFVKTPCPAGIVIRCYIERSQSFGKNYMTPCYSLCGDMEDGSGKELIVCRKVFKSKTAHYVFSMRETDLYRKRTERSRVYLGKLREVSPSEYVMFDSGSEIRKDIIGPDNYESEGCNQNDENEEEEKCANSAAEDTLLKSQLCSVYYHTKTRPTKGLGMEVCLPTVPSKKTPVLGDLRTDLRSCFEKIRKAGQQNELYADKCFIMQEKKSKYDPLSSCLVDFQGRANKSSVKNFQLLESTPRHLGERQLAEKSNDDEIIFQLGKASNDCFNMDFKYPLSMIQAFAIAISRFDAKISW